MCISRRRRSCFGSTRLYTPLRFSRKSESPASLGGGAGLSSMGGGYMRSHLGVVPLGCLLMSCVGGQRLLRQSAGPGPGPGCASTLDCACKNGSEEACRQMGSAPKASRSTEPRAPRTPEPRVDPVLPPPDTGQAAGSQDDDVKERCASYYARCVAAGGQNLPGRFKKESLCGSCLQYCTSNGFWPEAIYTWNGVRRPCLGV